MAQAYWLSESGLGELREVAIPEPVEGEVLVRTLHSGISRGTESIVHAQRVPDSQAQAMRAPFQEGDFSGPVKYGYLNVGVVESGPSELAGRTVFCLYPHQSHYVVPAASVTPLPEDVPPRRGVLTGTVETALNALWDAAPMLGDRITVIGAGMVGGAVAALASRVPGTEVTLVDIDPDRQQLADRLGVNFCGPHQAPRGQDLVVHASASAAGLQRGLEILVDEGTLLELSWYGDRQVSLSLGADFHSRRLKIRGSQVGTVSPARSRTRTLADRMSLAVDLLRDPAFDALLGAESKFSELPAVMARLTDTSLCHTINYQEFACSL